MYRVDVLQLDPCRKLHLLCTLMYSSSPKSDRIQHGETQLFRHRINTIADNKVGEEKRRKTIKWLSELETSNNATAVLFTLQYLERFVEIFTGVNTDHSGQTW